MAGISPEHMKAYSDLVESEKIASNARQAYKAALYAKRDAWRRFENELEKFKTSNPSLIKA